MVFWLKKIFFLLAGSYDEYVTFIRGWQISFHSNCIILHPHQQWMSVSIVLHPPKHLVVLVFWILTILIIVYRYSTFVLIFRSTIIYDMDCILYVYFSSVQFSHSVMSDSLQSHESQHARPPCPSPAPGVHSDSRHQVSDAIQPSHPLSSPSSSAPNPS